MNRKKSKKTKTRVSRRSVLRLFLPLFLLILPVFWLALFKVGLNHSLRINALEKQGAIEAWLDSNGQQGIVSQSGLFALNARLERKRLA